MGLSFLGDKMIRLKTFGVQNYKNFDKAKLSIKDQRLNLLCSETGTGKTNLGKALMDIKTVLFACEPYNIQDYILNIHSNYDVRFYYEFIIDEHIIEYQYAKSKENQLLFETLSFDQEVVMHMDFRLLLNTVIDYSFFGINKNLIVNYRKLLRDSDEQMSLLRWIWNNTPFDRPSIIKKLFTFVRQMKSISVSPHTNCLPKRLNQPEVESLNQFLKGMCYNYTLHLAETLDGLTCLYRKEKSAIPFVETASDGEKALCNLFFELQQKAKKNSLVYIDDIDKYFDTSLIKRVLKYLRYVYSDATFIAASCSELTSDFATVLHLEF